MVFILSSILLYACKKEQSNPVAPWRSTVFTGNYAGNETCLSAGNQSSTIQITAISNTGITVTNLYGSGQTFKGTLSGDTCTIAPQVYNTGSGNAVMQGQMILVSDTLSVFIIVSTFSHEETCKALLLKQ